MMNENCKKNSYLTCTMKYGLIFYISIVFVLISRIVAQNINIPDNYLDIVFTFMVQLIGFGLIPILLCILLTKRNPIHAFRVNIKINPWIFLIAVYMGVMLYLLTVGVSSISTVFLNLIGYTKSPSVGTIYSSPGVIILSYFLVAFLPGIFEELTYRGLALRVVGNLKDDYSKIIILALLFGLGHMFIQQTMYAFVGGIFFAYLAIKTHSIVPGMIMHIINNSISITLDISSQYDGVLSKTFNQIITLYSNSVGGVVIVAAAAGFMLVVSCLLCAKLSKNTKDPVRETETYKTGVYEFVSVSYSSSNRIDELYGVSYSQRVDADSGLLEKTSWHEYVFLIGSIIVMISATIVSFAQGILL